jgi:uncharacterized protein (DUF983 family)
MSDPVDTAPEYPPLNTLSTGIRCRCPRCGKGPLLKGYLTIRDECPVCGLDYSFADPADGPAFFVMSGVGVVGMMAFMAFEFTVHPPIWVHFAVTFPLLALMCLGSLAAIQGLAGLGTVCPQGRPARVEEHRQTRRRLALALRQKKKAGVSTGLFKFLSGSRRNQAAACSASLALT